ncbi:MAG: glycosyltransferase family 39 protein [Clostridia bacterium]|nr:glycosyltransferase family 39 protein [Clostridia bacterium]
MKKLDRAVFWICIALILFLAMALKPLSNLDELWNFNVARCISNGLVPYRDISMVSTPLLGFILAIPLKLCGQELYVSRIVTIIFFVIVFAIFHIILRKLDIKKEISYFSVMLLLFMVLDFVAINYNILALIFALLIVLFEIQYIKNSRWKKPGIDFVIGLLGGFMVCAKQSLGMIVCAVSILSLLFYIDAKSDIKKTCIRALTRFIGMIIPILVFIIYLVANNAFQGFLDYSILGIKTFSNQIPYSSLLHSKYSGIMILSVAFPIILAIAVVTNIIWKIKNKESNIFYVLTIYSIAMFSVVFPIADNEHFIVAMVLPIILCIYSINAYIRKNVKIDFKYVLEFVNIFTMVFVFSITLWIEFSNIEPLGKISKYQFQNHYKYISISNDFNAAINKIDDYITSSPKKVYILDASAAVYMIPIDRYNKDYDMFCLGNLGSGGENAQIERIKNEDAIYMIMKDDARLNWQNPSKVRAYIKENLEFVETIESYDVYRHKAIY